MKEGGTLTGGGSGDPNADPMTAETTDPGLEGPERRFPGHVNEGRGEGEALGGAEQTPFAQRGRTTSGETRGVSRDWLRKLAHVQHPTKANAP